MELGGEKYQLWKSQLLLIERQILKELGFFLYGNMDHPHKYLLYYTRLFDGSHELCQKSWNFLNDSMRLNLMMTYTAQEVVAAAIYMASRILNFPLPSQPSWWTLMTSNFNNVKVISENILKLYTIPKVIYFT
jgi:hypothetical protein